jgi:hypothetical protein
MTLKIKGQKRQGDILLEKIDKMPDGMIKTENKILALGEATGHKHQLIGNVQSYAKRGDLRQEVQVVEIVDPETFKGLVHEQHGAHEPHEFTSGLYKVKRQRIWNQELEEAKRAMD